MRQLKAALRNRPAVRYLRDQIRRDDTAIAGKAMGQAILKKRSPEYVRGLCGTLLDASTSRITFERDGIVWTTDLGDDVGRDLYRLGGYQQAEVEAVIRWLERNGRTGTVVDVGANIGTTSIPFACAGFDVLAIEPVPDTFAMLTENVSRNNVAVTCVQRAISEHAGIIKMWTGFGSGQGEVAIEGQRPSATRFGDAGSLVEVRSSPLDEIVNTDSVALVWADVQGSEAAVIRTGSDLWASGVPLYLEVDPVALDLHGGFEAFEREVLTRFDSFTPRDRLLDGCLEPIGEFGAWARTIGDHDFSDALLIPRVR